MSTPSTTAPPSSTATAAASIFQTAKHPTICSLHIVFKIATLFLFTLRSLIFGSSDFVFTFVFTTILLSIDFWIVKNLSGRLLVGLRWENTLQEDGSNKWTYESSTDESNVNSTDKTVFWTALVLWPLFWSTMSFFYFIKLEWDWMLLSLMALSLSGANLLGYWRCSNESKRKLQQLAASSAFKSITARLSALFV